MTHEKPAPPICEVCGRLYKKKSDSLKKHLNLKHEIQDSNEGTGSAKDKRRMGRYFLRIRKVHNYVNKRKMKKV